MRLSLRDAISQISIALDAVEADLLGATPYHSKRVSILSLAIGRLLGYDQERLFCLACCALLHDNALTEYILSERAGKGRAQNLRTHCILGQENAGFFPFQRSIDGFILYHHELADGSGAFGKREGEYPEEAGIIALADRLDVLFALQRLGAARLPEAREYIARESGAKYGRGIAGAALSVLDEPFLEALSDERIFDTLQRDLPDLVLDLTDRQIIAFAGIGAKIIDYKSEFTKIHSTQIANKAWYMSGVYGYPESRRAALYLAASFHDIGKLFIPTEILEKPGKLTDGEFEIIKSHALKTWEVLSPVRGFDEVALWASNHHEKLNGRGYPFGKTACQLDFNSRLLACLDIYQAVSEARPYHPPRSHEDTMTVLYDMAKAGFIDQSICKDLDRELRPLKDGYAPPPEQ